jgi:hypothetical protein
MIIQERYLDVYRQSPSSQIDQIQLKYLISPAYHQSGRVSQISASLGNPAYHHSGRFSGAILSVSREKHHQTGRVAGLILSLAGLSYYQSGRVSILGASYLSKEYHHSSRLIGIDLKRLWDTLYDQSARIGTFSLKHTGTTGSQESPTPIYYQSPKIGNQILSYLWPSLGQSPRIGSVALSRAGQGISDQTGRLSVAGLSYLRTLSHYQSGRVGGLLLQKIVSNLYQHTARLVESKLSWSHVRYYQSPRLQGLEIISVPVLTVYQKSPVILQALLRRVIVQDLLVVVPKDIMGDVAYYWVGWPGTDSPHKTRGRDSSYFLTMSLWKVPQEAAKSIEVWYPRLPIVQTDNNRLLEVYTEGASTFSLSSQILPEIGVYMPVLKNWLRSWYHSWKSGEYQKQGNLVSAGYHWNKHKDAEAVYEKALYRLSLVDTAARNASRYTRVKPFRL